jgi:thiol-disulfide isomerase/thioredoxin
VTERALVLILAGLIGVALLGLYRWYRVRPTHGPERLDVDALGLELMSGCCAFIVFTTPACSPCKAALGVVQRAAEKGSAPTEVATVDAIERSELATRYRVKTIPTVFLITASGHVVKRWKDVPDPVDVEAALVAV